MSDIRRLGLIVPSSNTAAERDFRRLMPEQVEVNTARMYLAKTTVSAERVMLDQHAPTAAEDLGTLHPDVVVFSCTSAGALLGVEGEAALEQDLGARCGAPIVSTNASVAWRLAGLGVRRVAVVTAYVEALNREIEATLAHRGFEVCIIRGMDITDNFAIGMVTPQEIADFCVDVVGDTPMDGLFISCTNLRSVEAVGELTDRLGVPVVTSNLAAAEAALAQLGLPGTGLGTQ
ncbi:MAG: maleate cis-trans isomerase family protein [Candidatus Dormibacteria bacterium]